MSEAAAAPQATTAQSAADLFASTQSPGTPKLDLTPTAPTETAPKVEEKVEEKKEGPLSEKYAALAREERRVQIERSKFKEESKGLSEYQSAKKNWRLDPMGLIKSLGADPQEFYDNFTQVILEGKAPKDAHVRELEEKLKKIEQDQKDRELAEKQSGAERAQQHARNELKNFVVQAGEKFELINMYQTYHLVEDEIISHYKATGQELDPSEAAQRVESQLEIQAEKYRQTNRYKTKYAPAKPELKPELPMQTNVVSEQTPSARVSQTLTNSASIGNTEPQKILTKEEEMAWAVKMLTK